MAGSVHAIKIVENGGVPADWYRATVQELIDDGSLESVQDGNHGGNYPKPEEFSDTGIPLVTGADIESGIVNLRTCKFLKPESAAKLRIGFAKTGDVLLSHKGTMGKTAIVPPLPTPYIILNPQLTLYRVSGDGALDRRYLKYFFDSGLFQSFLNRISGISTISTLSLSVQKSLEICFPPKPQQSAIAHILGTLDDKIELNRRMNETLEAMARALFKSWFVDFDPVRAKAEGRDPGLPKAIADLFPDAFDESVVGEIPAGWVVGTLADMSSLNPESWSKDTRPETIRYVDLSNTKWGRIESVTVYGQQDAPSRAQRVLRPGDTIVGTVRPGNGSYAFIFDDGLTGSTGFAVLRPKKPEYAEYVFLSVTSPDNIEELAHLADGGAYPAVRPDVVLGQTIVKSDGAVVEAFSRIIQSSMSKLSMLEKDSRILADIRDSLLPRFISGEVRIGGESVRV